MKLEVGQQVPFNGSTAEVVEIAYKQYRAQKPRELILKLLETNTGGIFTVTVDEIQVALAA